MGGHMFANPSTAHCLQPTARVFKYYTGYWPLTTGYCTDAKYSHVRLILATGYSLQHGCEVRPHEADHGGARRVCSIIMLNKPEVGHHLYLGFGLARGGLVVVIFLSRASLGAPALSIVARTQEVRDRHS